MMFKPAKEIDSAFRQMRGFMLAISISCIGLSCYSVYVAAKTAQDARDKLYILSNEKVFEALATDRRSNLPVEARDHVNTFHHYFFSLDPDDKAIQENIGRALYLADGTAKVQYENLSENGYYAGLIAGNISQEIAADSVVVDADQYPFHFRYYGKEKIIRPASIVIRNLVTEGYLRNVTRTDNNPHGFLIEKWRIVENKDLKTMAR